MPSATNVHTDSALSTFIAGYSNGDYIADVVCPVIKSDKLSDKFQTFSRVDASTPIDSQMGPTRATANEDDYTVSTTAFQCETYALKGYVSNDEIQNADDPHRPREKRARHLMNRILLGREIRAATLLQTTGNYASANTSAAGNVWSDATNGTPLADLHLMRAALAPGMYEETKVVLAIALEVWQALIRHPDMNGGGNAAPVATMDMVKAAINVDEILISDAMKNSANRGAAATYVRVWDKTKAVMVRVPVGEPEGETGLFAGTFRFNGASGEGVTVRRWDAPEYGANGGEAIQVVLEDDEVVVQNDMGYCLTGVLS